jgi:hypothetical protein
MISKDTQLLQEAYEKIVTEFLGFGKKEEAPHVGVKFANMLVKGLLAKGFKEEKLQGGFRFKKTNKLGSHLIFTFGGGDDKFKETTLSILHKFDKPSDNFKDTYKTYVFPTIDLRVDPQDQQAVKKKHAENEEHENMQREKISGIYDIIQAFEKGDFVALKEMMPETNK